MWSSVVEPDLFTMDTIAQPDPWPFLGSLLSDPMHPDSCSLVTANLSPVAPIGGDPGHSSGNES